MKALAEIAKPNLAHSVKTAFSVYNGQFCIPNLAYGVIYNQSLFYDWFSARKCSKRDK